MKFSMRHPVVAIWFAAPWLLVSCSTAQVTKHPNSDLEELRVLVQVCKPDKRVAFTQEVIDLTGIPPAKTVREERTANGYPKSGTTRRSVTPADTAADDRATVRRWDHKAEKDGLSSSGLASEGVWDSDGVASAGSMSFVLWTDTDKHQPVYESLDKRQDEIVALGVAQEAQINGKPEMVTYWYALPSKIQEEKFTEWLAPATQETNADQSQRGEAMFLQLTHGRKMVIRPIQGTPPKMRFRLTTLEDHYNDNRFWTRAQKAVAQKYYKSLPPQMRGKIHFAPHGQEAVPGC